MIDSKYFCFGPPQAVVYKLSCSQTNMIGRGVNRPKCLLFRHMVKKLTKWSKPTKRRQKCHYYTNYTGTSIWYCTQWFASINSSAIRFMGLFAKFRRKRPHFFVNFLILLLSLVSNVANITRGNSQINFSRIVYIVSSTSYFLRILSSWISDHTKSIHDLFRFTLYQNLSYILFILWFYF